MNDISQMLHVGYLIYFVDENGSDLIIFIVCKLMFLSVELKWKLCF